MRNFLLLATSLALIATACSDSVGELKDPPVLEVTSPQRSLIRDHAGSLLVTGTVAPNVEGTPVSKVMVNGVAATVNADGSWTATIDVKPGASLIETEATDKAGGKATDTRSVEAGQLRAPGANIENAVTTAISKNAFAKIASAAGTIVKGMDFRPMLAPMNPVMHSGDESGEDCLFARLFVDDFKMTNATITLVPVVGGLSFSAKLDGIDIPGRARYAVACVDGSNTVRVQASSVLVKGTLTVTPDGMQGFKTDLANPVVQITGLNISASGLPGAVLDMLPLDSLIQRLAPVAAKLFMGPMVNKALGGLSGPKTLSVLGKTITVEVDPSDVAFDADGGLITLDMKMLIGGTETSKGFIFTDNGFPTMDPGTGLQLGLADDLANSMLSQLVATGMLNLKMPQQGGTFDSTEMQMTSPPMISADPASGMMRLVLPDMISTFTLQGAPVARAAINAVVELKITPANNGYGIAIELGKPIIHANTLHDIPNYTTLTDADLALAVELCLEGQIKSISALLGSIPLPAMPGGLMMKDMSVSSDDGYVMMKGTLE
ncbi:MAG TPA: hypothetical protein VIV40_21055 [Kofleriaceae bacterium]